MLHQMHILKWMKSENSSISTLDGVPSVTAPKIMSESQLEANNRMATPLPIEDNAPTNTIARTSITEPNLKELIIEAPAPSSGNSPTASLGNIQALFSFDNPIEDSHLSTENNEGASEIEIRKHQEDTLTTRFSSSSIISFKLKPITKVANESTNVKNEMGDIDPALNEALSVIRLFKSISFDYENEEDSYFSLR